MSNMLDQGDGAFVYAVCLEAINNGNCDASMDELNNNFTERDVEEGESLYKDSLVIND